MKADPWLVLRRAQHERIEEPNARPEPVEEHAQIEELVARRELVRRVRIEEPDARPEPVEGRIGPTRTRGSRRRRTSRIARQRASVPPFRAARGGRGPAGA